MNTLQEALEFLTILVSQGGSMAKDIEEAVNAFVGLETTPTGTCIAKQRFPVSGTMVVDAAAFVGDGKIGDQVGPHICINHVPKITVKGRVVVINYVICDGKLNPFVPLAVMAMVPPLTPISQTGNPE